jgi:two-component system sensor histidine kinase BarA
MSALHAHPGRRAALVDPGEARPDWRDLRVLVVEDEPVQAIILLLFLERLGVDAMHVTGGEDALEAVRTQPFAMVLMDQYMPGMSGADTARRIRAWEESRRRPRLPIVAVTASAMTDECRSYLEAGMDEVLAKPFTLNDLQALLMRYMPSRRHAPARQGS